MKYVRVWFEGGKEEVFKEAKDIQNNGLEISFSYHCSSTNSRMSARFKWTNILGYAVTEE